MKKSIKNKAPKKNSPGDKIKGTSADFYNRWYAIAAIMALTAIVFSNSITKNFVALDDTTYIEANPFIRSLSWQNIRNIFTSFYNANYHPLTTLGFAIEFKLFGLNASPYHIISLIFHLANVYLVFILIKSISHRTGVALITALLFGIHPMHVESVAWISELKDVLYTFFYLAGLIAYSKYVQQGNRKYLFITIFLFVLSLLSKSAAVTFPLIIVSFDYYFKRKWNWQLVAEKTPFFLLSVLFGILAIQSQRLAGAIQADRMVPYTFIQRIFVVSYSLVFYLVKLLFPFNLSALYYAPKQLPFYFYICPVIIVLIVYLIIKAKRMKRELIFGSLFFLFSIILSIQIIPVGYSIVSERYSYVPYIGLFFIGGLFFMDILEGRFSFSLKVKPYLYYILAGFVVLFVSLSFQRNKVWKDNLSLFTDIVQNNPNSAYAQFELGKVNATKGDFNAALNSYSKAIEFNSTDPQFYFYRANIYHTLKNGPLELKDYLSAITLKPDYSEALGNIGMLLMNSGRSEESINYFSRGIALMPNEFLYEGRASAYFYLKKFTEALSDYNNALRLNPSSSESYFNRGICYYSLQKDNEACMDFRKASSMGYEKARAYVDSYCK